MRYESATVPAAVMPDRFTMMVLGNTCHCSGNWNGKASRNRDKSEDLPDKLEVQSFREKKRRINFDSHDSLYPGSIK